MSDRSLVDTELAQRVIARYHLQALTPAETAQYVRHRMEVCGLERPLPFDGRALKRIHALTGGVPRRINLLCDRALLGGYTAQTTRIDEDLVVTAAEGLDLKPPVRSQRSFFSRLLRRA